MFPRFRVVLLTVLTTAFTVAALCGCTALTSSDSLIFNGRQALDYSIQQAAANGADYEETAVATRDYYNDVSQAEDVTVMVYMCASDLESGDGAATADINEMLHAKLGNNINVIVETGGTTYWNNTVMSSGTNQIWKLSNNGIVHLKDVGLEDMTKPSTLAEFLSYCQENFPADRNILVLWDHGGGSVGGYGYDENFPYSTSMAIDSLGKTIDDSGVKFDIVGFDACLMASVEDALVLEPSTDYMIASEIPEPGQGWYYTNWLSALAKDPSISSEALGTRIVDDFISYSHDDNYPQAQTLSMIDLTKLPTVLGALGVFSDAASGQLANGDFSTLSKARQDCVGRSTSKDYGMVDIEALASKLASNTGSDELIDAIDSSVVYTKSVNAGNDQHGLTIAFPYSDLSDYPELTTLYSSIGFSKSYAGFLSDFETVRSGGQNSGALDSSAVDLSSLPWFQEWLSQEYADNGSYDTESTLGNELPVTKKGSGYVLQLTDEQWDSIVDIQLAVLYGRQNAYLDLGSDELYEFDDDGDLKINYDGTWLALDGQIVEFYADSNVDNDDGSWVSTGYVPALVNGDEAQIVLQWDNKHKDGYVTGYRNSYSSGVAQKGVTSFKNGDKIQYTYNYYDSDNFSDKYAGTYTTEDAITYNGGLTVSYEEIGNDEAIVRYVLTDVYGNEYPTESLVYS